MKTSMFAAVMIVLCLGACNEKPVVEVVERPEKQTVLAEEVYPFQRSIMHKTGKVIAVEILGRSEDSVMFHRKDTGRNYTLKIDDLFYADQERMLRLPVRPVVFDEPLSDREKAVKRLVAFRMEERKRYQRKLDELVLERNVTRSTINDGEISRLQDKIEKLNQDIKQIEASGEIR